MKYLKFWNPDSGLIGGIICGFAIVALAIIIIPPLLRFAIWWFDKWFK